MKAKQSRESRLQDWGTENWDWAIHGDFPALVWGFQLWNDLEFLLQDSEQGDAAREDRQKGTEILQQPQAGAVCTKGRAKLLGFCSNGTLEDLVIIPGNMELFLNPSSSLDLIDSWGKECHVLTPSLILKTKQPHRAVSCPHFQSVAFVQREEESRSSFNYFSFSNLPLPYFILFFPALKHPEPISPILSLLLEASSGFQYF